MRRILLALMLAAPPAWAETNVCTVITSLPYVISTPGAYCLEQNLSLPMSVGNEVGINIHATTDVVLDCNGFAITGTTLPPTSDVDTTYNYTGIKVGSSARVTVRNCRVDGFFRGIVAERGGNALPRSRDVIIEDNRVDGSLLGIYAISEGSGEVRRNLVSNAAHTAFSTFLPLGKLRVADNLFSRTGNTTLVVGGFQPHSYPIVIQGGGGWLVFESNVIAETIAPAGASTPVVKLVNADFGIGVAMVGNLFSAPAIAGEAGSADVPFVDDDPILCADNLFVGYGTSPFANCTDPSNEQH